MEDLTVPKLALQIGLPEILLEVPVSQRLLKQTRVSPNMSKDPQAGLWETISQKRRAREVTEEFRLGHLQTDVQVLCIFY